MSGIKANERIRAQLDQLDVDLVLMNLKLQNLGQPHDKALITGSVQNYKIFIPEQLANEVFRSMH